MPEEVFFNSPEEKATNSMNFINIHHLERAFFANG
jgi:hypothetical protein